MTAFTELSSLLRARKRGRVKEEMGGLARREARWGLLFLSPWIIGFLLFYLIPMGASLVFSFTDFTLERPKDMQFIGLTNYIRLFNDPQVRKSLLVTARFMLVAIPVGVVWPIFLAVLLNAKSLRAKQLFRTLYFMPNIVPIVSGADSPSLSKWIGSTSTVSASRYSSAVAVTVRHTSHISSSGGVLGGCP